MKYTGKHIFEVQHDQNFGSIKVEIDFDRVTNEKSTFEWIQEMVTFWSQWKIDLKECNNDYVRLFLYKLAFMVLEIDLEHRCSKNTGALIVLMTDEEGWCPLDGSFGIRLLSHNSPALRDFDDYTIKNLTYA